VIRPRLPLAALSLVLVLAGPARAADDLANVLLHAPNPAAVRRDLAAFAAHSAPADTVVSGAAWALIASSYHREGLADSAITCGERAVARHADADALDALIDAHLVRQGSGDVAPASCSPGAPISCASTPASGTWPTRRAGARGRCS
jgi:hypothetical protein